MWFMFQNNRVIIFFFLFHFFIPIEKYKIVNIKFLIRKRLPISYENGCDNRVQVLSISNFFHVVPPFIFFDWVLRDYGSLFCALLFYFKVILTEWLFVFKQHEKWMKDSSNWRCMGRILSYWTLSLIVL